MSLSSGIFGLKKSEDHMNVMGQYGPEPEVPNETKADVSLRKEPSYHKPTTGYVS